MSVVRSYLFDPDDRPCFEMRGRSTREIKRRIESRLGLLRPTPCFTRIWDRVGVWHRLQVFKRLRTGKIRRVYQCAFHVGLGADGR